ncbi:NAD(P)H-binding protein [Shewanella sp. NIFS-20-20]|uniref:NAD(P)H-binding protein n=1 Tax=Shewanella sp. NIFS-20-20 TaxID=2853806 RepID=UPI001C45F5B4|nr:NAD(P)H-binding protein [Shewanella sp. NIFS-20-20]MBV7317433.1 NAD(P)H-binding protein [Shewanella sp. NIFS-20-20]
MGKRAIVLGATGVVGRALVEILSQSPAIESVTAISRRKVVYQRANIINQVIDFDRLNASAEVFNGDVLFSCLGTTAKLAGSKAKQRLVDVDYQYQAAQLAFQRGVNHYLLVSSSGANAASRHDYLQMKGELEQKVAAIGFKRVSIFQPSLIIGQRHDVRVGEIIGSRLMPWLCQLPMLAKYRPITGEQVALSLTATGLSTAAPTQRLTYYRLDELHQLAKA